jgi:hypothetical protein
VAKAKRKTKPAASKASRAAKKGWETRRANELREKRAAAARKGWRKRKAIKPKQKPGRPKKQTVMFLVTLKFQTRRRRGEPPTKFKRDLLIPAPPDATFRDLKKIAQDTLPPEAQPLLEHFKKKNVTIAPGPKTRARKATDR